MKKQITVITLALALCALVGTMALAKGESHKLSLNEDTMVNGTLVKKGEYRAKFDSETGMLTIKKMDDNDVVVKAKATEMPLGKKAEYTSFEVSQSDSGVAVLKSVTFHGDRDMIVLNNVTTASVGGETVETFQ
jgi:hypothetical protein